MTPRTVLLMVLVVAMGSCAAQNDHRRPPQVVAPSFAAGARVHSRSGITDSSVTTATLVIRLADVRGRPIPYANVSIPGIRFGALSDLDGWAWIHEVPVGDRMVRWNVAGVPRPDSLRVHLEPGRTETLNVSVAFPREPGRNDRP